MWNGMMPGAVRTRRPAATPGSAAVHVVNAPIATTAKTLSESRCVVPAACCSRRGRLLVMSETEVYVAPAVAAVRALWDSSGSRVGPVIGAQLSAFADALRASRAAFEDAAEVLVGNWLEAPRWRSQDQGAADVLPSTGSLSLREARLIVARDHGFTSWSIVGGECDPIFELAVDAVVLGRIEQLDRLLVDALISSVVGQPTATAPRCCTTRPLTGSRSVAKLFPPTPLRSPLGSWMPARMPRQRSTRTEEPPTRWRCSNRAHILAPPVWRRRSSWC